MQFLCFFREFLLKYTDATRSSLWYLTNDHWPYDSVIFEIWDSLLEFHITYDLLCGFWEYSVSIVMKRDLIILPTFSTSSTFNSNDRLQWFWFCVYVITLKSIWTWMKRINTRVRNCKNKCMTLIIIIIIIRRTNELLDKLEEIEEIEILFVSGSFDYLAHDLVYVS